MLNAAFTFFYGLPPGFGIAAIIVNDLTYVFLALLLLGALILAKRKFFTVALLFLSGITAWLAANILKFVFHTTRPPGGLDITALVSVPGYSFPSAHAAAFAALAVSMFIIDRRVAIALSVLAVLVGISRVILGVHYPIDVLGGFAVGAVVALLYIRLFRKL